MIDKRDYPDLEVTDLLDAEDAPIWSPAKEDTRDHDRDLLGTIVDIGEFIGDYGSSPVFIIDRGNDGEQCNPPGRFAKWFAFGKVAADEIDRNQPRVGDKMGVRFKGFGEVQAGANRGKPYPIYRVVVQHTGRPPDGTPPDTLRDVEHVGGSDIPTDDPPPRSPVDQDFDQVLEQARKEDGSDHPFDDV